MSMSSNDNKDKDPNKLDEEEMLALLDELKKRKHSKKVSVSLGFLLHRNYMIHMVLSLGVNFLIAAVVFGLTVGINQPLVAMNVTGFIMAFMLLTLIENFAKILLFKYLARAMILSMGLLSVVVQILILYSIDMIIVDGFHFINVENIIIFAFSFSILRLVFATYLRRWLYNDRIVFLGGGKK